MKKLGERDMLVFEEPQGINKHYEDKKIGLFMDDKNFNSNSITVL